MRAETLMSRCAASMRAQRAVSSSSVTVTFFITRFSCYTDFVSTLAVCCPGKPPWDGQAPAAHLRKSSSSMRRGEAFDGEDSPASSHELATGLSPVGFEYGL